MAAQDHVLLVTTTLYSDLKDPVQAARAPACFRTAEEAARYGFSLITLDASPLPEIAHELERCGAITLRQQTRGMGPSRREAFFYAVEHCRRFRNNIIVWLEAEKYDFVRSVEVFVAKLLSGEAHMVLPLRSEFTWQSYHPLQREMEEETNQRYVQATGVPRHADPTFGPVGFVLEAHENFVLLRKPLPEGVSDGYWNFLAPVLAKKDGFTVEVSDPLDFIYDTEQRKAEERDPDIRTKRVTQRDVNSLAVELLAAA